MVEQLLDDLEQDDRMITVWVIRTIYPQLSIRDVFEILDNPLLLETLLNVLCLIPEGSIEKLND